MLDQKSSEVNISFQKEYFYPKARLIAKKRAAGLLKTNRLSPEIYIKINKMMLVISKAISKYTGNSFAPNYLFRGTNGFEILHKMVNYADELNVSYEDFVRSQFYWFDRWFRRMPKISEYATEKTKQRYTDWTKLSDDEKIMYGIVSIETNKKDVEENIKSTIDLIIKRTNKEIKRMMKDFSLSKEEVFIKFGSNGTCIFPKEFLDQDITYQELKKNGLLK